MDASIKPAAQSPIDPQGKDQRAIDVVAGIVRSAAKNALPHLEEIFRKAQSEKKPPAVADLAQAVSPEASKNIAVNPDLKGRAKGAAMKAVGAALLKGGIPALKAGLAALGEGKGPAGAAKAAALALAKHGGKEAAVVFAAELGLHIPGLARKSEAPVDAQPASTGDSSSFTDLPAIPKPMDLSGIMSGALKFITRQKSIYGDAA